MVSVGTHLANFFNNNPQHLNRDCYHIPSTQARKKEPFCDCKTILQSSVNLFPLDDQYYFLSKTCHHFPLFMKKHASVSQLTTFPVQGSKREEEKIKQFRP